MRSTDATQTIATLALTAGLLGISQGAAAALLTFDFSSGDQGFTAAGATGAATPFFYDSATGTWQVNGVAAVGTATLAAPVLTALGESVSLSFSHSYQFETGFDGGQLRVRLDDGPDQVVGVDIGTLTAGDYTRTISQNFGSPIAGELAWSAAASLVSSATLTGLTPGTSLAFTWLAAWDSSFKAVDPNWALHSVSVGLGTASVPLPGTLALLGLGLGLGLGLRGRYRSPE